MSEQDLCPRCLSAQMIDVDGPDQETAAPMSGEWTCPNCGYTTWDDDYLDSDYDDDFEEDDDDEDY